MPGRYYQGPRGVIQRGRKDCGGPVLTASAEESLQGGREELGSLGDAAAREVDLGTALGVVIGRLEAGGDHQTGRSRAHEEAIAAVLVGEAGDDDVEGGGVRLADHSQSRPLAGPLRAHSRP